MASLYSNENFDQRVVETLRALGHDVLTTLDAGNAGSGVPDEDVLAFAASQNRILVTFNRRDFIYLHDRVSEHAGIVVCTEDRDAAALAQRIHDAIDGQDLAGRVVRINRPPT
ncbi:MAG: DUF5615 family PIN-like protein [Planctomycetota bacterium]